MQLTGNGTQNEGDKASYWWSQKEDITSWAIVVCRQMWRISKWGLSQEAKLVKTRAYWQRSWGKNEVCNKAPFPLYKNKICGKAFFNELDRELGNLVTNKFSLHRKIFNVFNQCVNIITKPIDKHAPFERISRKQRKLAVKPRITKEILTFIRKKNSMFQTRFITGNTVEKSFYRLHLNMLTKIKSLSKKIYYYSEYANNNKKTCIKRGKL